MTNKPSRLHEEVVAALDAPSAKGAPTVEEMLEAILSVVTLAADEEPRTEDRERRRVVLSVEQDRNTRHYKLVERVTGLEGAERVTLRDAVASLYDELVRRASVAERAAAERLRRLGVRK